MSIETIELNGVTYERDDDCEWSWSVRDGTSSAPEGIGFGAYDETPVLLDEIKRLQTERDAFRYWLMKNGGVDTMDDDEETAEAVASYLRAVKT